MIARQETFNSRDEVWSALAAPVSKAAISWRQDGKPVARDGRHFARFVCYIEANTVRERLDTVVPGEWDLTLDMLPQIHGADVDSDSVCAFKARLQVLGVIREDVGTGRDYKQAATDAFKRAAVRFGIGNELYSYEQNWVELDGDAKFAKPVEDPASAYARRYGTPEPLHRSVLAMDRSEPSTATEVDAAICPKCGGGMWDNRLTKRNPKAPDYKCRDRNCDGVVWPARSNDSAIEADPKQHPDDAASLPEVPTAPVVRKSRAAKLALSEEIPF